MEGNGGSRKAIIIGVSDYDILQPLNFCKNDGDEMYKVLKSLNYEILPTHKLIGRVKREEMRDAIIDFFLNKNVRPKDTLLFYFSGHGVLDGHGDHYLATSALDPFQPDTHGFLFDELTRLIDKSNSQKIVTILDCCYSGAAKVGKGGDEDAANAGRKALDEKSHILEQGEGRCILAASQARQKAFETAQKNHSLFTYYLIEGLKGNEESVDYKGHITPDSLGKYAFDKIMSLPPEEKPMQRPIRKGTQSGDIILGHYPKFARKPKEIDNSEVPSQYTQSLKGGQGDNIAESINTIRKEHPPRSRTRIWIWILIAGASLAVILIFIIGTGLSPSSSPVQEQALPPRAVQNVCHPSYPDLCMTPDLNCDDISIRNFQVLPPDPYGFDGDNDGLGCEAAANNIPTLPAEQSIVTDQDTSIPITLTANDADNDSLRFSIVSQPSHGSLSGTAPNLVYTPQQGYAGADSFTYKVNDGKTDSNIGNITLNMEAQTIISRQETEDITAPTTPRGNEPITVKTDKPSYSKGDTITIAGTVIEREPGETLWISIVDPNSNEVVATTIPVTGSNTFTLSFTANNQDLAAIEGNIGNSQMNTSGVYLVTANYWINEENVIAETTFAFTA